MAIPAVKATAFPISPKNRKPIPSSPEDDEEELVVFCCPALLLEFFFSFNSLFDLFSLSWEYPPETISKVQQNAKIIFFIVILKAGRLLTILCRQRYSCQTVVLGAISRSWFLF